jgi:hypothetical protein
MSQIRSTDAICASIEEEIDIKRGVQAVTVYFTYAGSDTYRPEVDETSKLVELSDLTNCG